MGVLVFVIDWYSGEINNWYDECNNWYDECKNSMR